jgi:hypothetical protein
VKVSRRSIYRKFRGIPRLRFEDQQLSSFSGLIVFQRLFQQLDLRTRIRGCFAGEVSKRSYSAACVVETLMVHVLLGYRQLRDVAFYQDDPIVKRVLGLASIPGQSTLSRVLNEINVQAVERLRELMRELSLERLSKMGLRRVTLDFDGSVQSTRRHAEGTAVGYNKIKKGARSYYNLYCTLAQTGQVFDLLARSGNVHDSRGALEFIIECVSQLQQALPGAVVEVRMDGAFFSDELVKALEWLGVEFTISVPFHRFAELKERIEHRRRWGRLNGQVRFFEQTWKPMSWARKHRFIFVRKEVAYQQKAPIQLDLFEPVEFGYDYKVIITNKKVGARKVLRFHEGRGQQENVFSELKTHAQMDYIPVRSWIGNQVYLLCGLLAHNLSRELQMGATAPRKQQSETRQPLWIFQELESLRKKFIQRAGRLNRPEGVLTLTLNANRAVQEGLLKFLHA